MSIDWGEAGKLTVWGIIAVIVLVRFREWAVRPPTVEQEADVCRETAAASAAWHGFTTQPEYTDEHEMRAFALDTTTDEEDLFLRNHGVGRGRTT